MIGSHRGSGNRSAARAAPWRVRRLPLNSSAVAVPLLCMDDVQFKRLSLAASTGRWNQMFPKLLGAKWDFSDVRSEIRSLGHHANGGCNSSRAPIIGLRLVTQRGRRPRRKQSEDRPAEVVHISQFPQFAFGPGPGAWGSLDDLVGAGEERLRDV